MRYKMTFKTIKASILLAALLLFTLPALTAEKAEIPEHIIKRIQKIIPTLIPNSKISKKDIRTTPLPNLYEVTVGAHVYYISKDGKYLFAGTLLDLEKREDLTEPRVVAARIKVLNSIGEDKMIIFSPAKDKVKHVITVFTDIDCPYCRAMHNQIGEYLKLGIKVRYMLFPRAPVNTPTYNKAVSVWCSKDRAAALTQAKSGKAIQNTSCDNPVADHIQIGSSLGVTGTPSIITSDGQVIPGFVTAKELIKVLDNKKLSAR